MLLQTRTFVRLIGWRTEMPNNSSVWRGLRESLPFRKKTRKMEPAKSEEAVAFLRRFFGTMRQWQLDGTSRADEQERCNHWEESNRMNEKGYELYLKNRQSRCATSPG